MVQTLAHLKQASQLIVELGKTISNPQRQTLANLYIAVDTAIHYSTSLNKPIKLFVNACMK